MLQYEYPIFDFSAPVEFATRAEEAKSKNPPYRSDFMRDRDRVMYSGSFRRLAGKTQIYLAGKNDNQRNRLTHTLEVSQIARTISQALGLDCDLTEAIALGHDIGHTPFGHAGEQVLHEIMVPGSKVSIKNSPMAEGSPLVSSAERKLPLFGFKHNIQSIRVAISVENNYGNYGLNLTNYTLWGILHHSSLCYKKGRVNTEICEPDYCKQYEPFYSIPGSPGKEAWSFEAFVVAQADEIAQWHHDLEDALRGNAMSGSDVCNTLRRNLGSIMSAEDSSKLKALKEKKVIDSKYIADISRIVVNTLVNRLIECSFYNLGMLWNKYVYDISNKSNFFLSHDWNEREIKDAIKLGRLDDDDKMIQFLESQYPNIISEKIHHSRDVERMNAKGQYIIKKLFQAYFTHPQQLPDGIITQYMIDIEQYTNFQKATQAGMGAVRTKFEKLHSNKATYGIREQIMLMRRICDHIAGMTDHYAIEEYKNLYE